MPESIRILLVDDQRLMRDGLRTLLELEPDLDVVGEVSNGQEAVQIYPDLQPNVVLMDIRMPVMNGVEATERLCQDWPDAKIIILTTFDDDAYVFDGIRAGAKGYLLKDVSGEELATAVRAVSSGSALLGSSVAQRVLAQFAGLAASKSASALPEPLSDRELEILQLIAEGLSNPEIAARLFLAEGTVKNYVSNILQKTDTRDRTQAVLKAQSLGLLQK
ncbi:MAG: response regulator transcription factor [Ardenticatenaceae bacterium]|nr:response regulator transcription factor [Ardenticatenaceae bacterium]